MAVINTSEMGKYNLLPFKIRKAKAFWYSLKSLICEALQRKEGVSWQGPTRFKQIEEEMKGVYGEPNNLNDEQIEIVLVVADEDYGMNPMDLVIKNEEVNAQRQQYQNR